MAAEIKTNSTLFSVFFSLHNLNEHNFVVGMKGPTSPLQELCIVNANNNQGGTPSVR